MDFLRILGVFTVVPAAMLLTVSFFVLFTLTKIVKKPLRLFGLVITVLLWIAALIIFATGMFILSKGNHHAYPGYKSIFDPHHGFMSDPHHAQLNGSEEDMKYDHHHGWLDTNHHGKECPQADWNPHKTGNATEEQMPGQK